MKWMVFVLLFCFCFGVVVAGSAEVVLVDDIGSFSGAVLRLKSSVEGELGDKIYASENLADVGIIKFEIESSLAEVYLDFIVTKDGEVIDSFEAGPFAVNGSEILIERREGVEAMKKAFEAKRLEDEKRLEEVKRLEEEKKLMKVEVVNTTEEIEVIVDVENNSGLLKKKFGGMILTGKSIFVEEDGSVDLGFSIGGGIFILIFVVFILVIVGRGKKAKVEILSEDDRELAYMEKKVKDAESRLLRVKVAREKRAKIEEAKRKFLEEKKELEELEEKERQEAEKIEDM